MSKQDGVSRISRLIKDGKIYINTTPSGKNWFYDLMCSHQNGQDDFVILKPGEVWDNNKPVDTETCIHDWHDILLFRFTVTECKKCGVIRDE